MQKIVLRSILAFVVFVAHTEAATHDEIAECDLRGVYKTRQTIVESPNYPLNYPVNICWDFVLRSPYKCPTTFHIQFLDFSLENSQNCTNDYLAVGQQSDGDDMDVLCGQITGFKKYHTPDGVLRLRFYSDNSPWTRGKGFRLIVTRLACESDSLLRSKLGAIRSDIANDDDEDDEDTVSVNAPPKQIQMPEHNSRAPYHNGTRRQQEILQLQQQQLQQIPFITPPYYGNYQIAGQLPGPPRPGFGSFYLPQAIGTQYPSAQSQPPCSNENQSQQQQSQQQSQQQLTQQQLAQQQQLSQQQLAQQQLVQAQLAQQQITQQQIEQSQLAQQLPQQENNLGQFPAQLPAGYQAQLGAFQDQYVTSPYPVQPLLKANEFPVGVATTTEGCCVSPFRQNHFYLSSPDFPRTVFTALLPTQRRDCLFQFEKSTGSVCRMRIEFRFFDFGQTYGGVGLSPENFNIGIGTSRDVCRQDFIEIDGERFCGCRSGYTYNSPWTTGKKTLHMRMGHSGITSNGFLLEIFQEECTAAEQQQQQQLAQRLGPLSALAGNAGLNNNSPQLQNNNFNPGFGGALGTQQLNGFGGYNSQNFNQLQLQQQQQQALLAQQQSLLAQQSGLFGQQGAYYPGQQPFQQQQQQFYQQSLLQGNPYQINPGFLQGYAGTAQQLQQPFGRPQFPQFRNSRGIDFAKAINDQQPLTVVEQNSTRKEYYFFDGDQAFARTNLGRDGDEQIVHDDRERADHAPQQVLTKAFTTERNKCTYDAADVLRLSIDTLWIMKPLCITPPSRWFSNIVG